MKKLSGFLCIFLFTSCSYRSDIQEEELIEKPTTVNMISPQIDVLQKEQQERKDTFVQTSIENCDSLEFRKTSEELARIQGVSGERLNLVVASAPERCKIRSIIRDGGDCRLLNDIKSVERCEYAKGVVKEMEEFQEKQKIYNRLF